MELTSEADLLKDDIRAIASPGQATASVAPFQTARGILEDLVETNVFPSPTAVSGVQLKSQISATSVFAAATAQGIPLVALTPQDPGSLDQLALDATAKVRITSALQQGLVIIIPSKDVVIGGQSTVAWFQLDPVTGAIVGVGEDGSHQELAQYGFTEAVTGGLLDNPAIQRAMGALAALDTFTQLKGAYNINLFAARVENLAVIGGPSERSLKLQELKTLKKDADDAVTEEHELIGELAGLETFDKVYGQVLQALVFGFSLKAFFSDPPVAPVLSAAPSPFFDFALGQLDVPVQNVTANSAVTTDVTTSSLALSGGVGASWSTAATSSFMIQSFQTTNATVENTMGTVVGSGTPSAWQRPLPRPPQSPATSPMQSTARAASPSMAQRKLA